MSKEIFERLEKGRITRRGFLKGAGLAAGTVALSSVFGFRSFGQGPVTIGAIHPLTGPLAEFGQPEINADLLAVEHLNEAAGRQLIALEVGDTQTAAAPAIAEANRLVDVVGVPALIGGAASGVTIPVAQSVTIPKEVLQVSYASTSPQITHLVDKDFLFRTCPSDALQGVVAGRLAKELGFNTAATLYVNNPYGQGLSNIFTETFEGEGGQVLAEVPHPEEAQPSYVAELQQALEGNPDVLCAYSYPGHAVVYLREAIEQFGYQSFLFCDGTKSLTIPEEVGAENVEGFYGTAPGSEETPSTAVFVAEYEAKYGEKPPLPFLDTSYDATIVVGLAVYVVQAVGAPVNGANLRSWLRFVARPGGEALGAGVDDLKKAFELLDHVGDVNYEGAAGSVDFDEHGDVVTPVDIWQYQNGEPVTLEKRRP